MGVLPVGGVRVDSRSERRTVEVAIRVELEPPAVRLLGGSEVVTAQLAGSLASLRCEAAPLPVGGTADKALGCVALEVAYDLDVARQRRLGETGPTKSGRDRILTTTMARERVRRSNRDIAMTGAAAPVNTATVGERDGRRARETQTNVVPGLNSDPLAAGNIVGVRAASRGSSDVILPNQRVRATAATPDLELDTGGARLVHLPRADLTGRIESVHRLGEDHVEVGPAIKTASAS